MISRFEKSTRHLYPVFSVLEEFGELQKYLDYSLHTFLDNQKKNM